MGEFQAPSDELRDGASQLLTNLPHLGIERILLATGDRREVAEAIAAGLPIVSVRPELTPDRKVLVVISERMRDDIDINYGTILDGEAITEEMRKLIFDAMIRTASGEQTSSAVLFYGDDEVRAVAHQRLDLSRLTLALASNQEQ